MHLWEAIVLGVVEGLTEFLPVSSTGHLLLVSAALGHNDDAAKSLSVVIQLGAVLAVVVYYAARLRAIVGGVLSRGEGSGRTIVSFVVGAFPVMLLGLLFGKWIKEHLFSPLPIAGALIVGGVVMIAIDRLLPEPAEAATGAAAAKPGDLGVSLRQATIVGLAQSLALWPGTSRSMTTIVGGRLSGLSTFRAAEFSFLLSVPVLGAATVYDLYKNRALFADAHAAVALAGGLVSAFVVSWIAIAAFLRFVRRFGLTPFGVYRIVLGVVVIGAYVKGWLG